MSVCLEINTTSICLTNEYAYKVHCHFPKIIFKDVKERDNGETLSRLYFFLQSYVEEDLFSSLPRLSFQMLS